MGIIDAHRLVTADGKVVGVEAKLRKPQRLDFRSTHNFPSSFRSRKEDPAFKPTEEDELQEGLWAMQACQDYLFNMAVKSRHWFSLAEALHDFERWGLEVVWGEDQSAVVHVMTRGQSGDTEHEQEE